MLLDHILALKKLCVRFAYILLNSLTTDANHIVLFSHNIITSVSKCYYPFVSLLYLFYIIIIILLCTL